MKKLAKYAAKILDTVTADLEVGGARKIETNTVYQALHVDRIAGDMFALAHYYKQNGDSVADPDMVFYRRVIGGETVWYPVTFQNSMTYQEAIVFKDGQVQGYKPNLVKELASFANMWMKNVKEQQNLSALKKAA